MSPDMQELKKLYYESGIWLKFNWYDFLEEFLKLMKEIKCSKSSQSLQSGPTTLPLL